MTIFKNQFGHFRAGWRILFCLGIVIACIVPVAGLFKLWALLSPRVPGSGNQDDFTSLVNILWFTGLTLAAVAGSWLTLRWVDKRPYKLLGLDFNARSMLDFAKGFLLGFINFLMIFLVMNLFGVIEVKLSNVNSILLLGMVKYFIAFTAGAMFEEVINRGYFFQALIEGTRIWIAVGIIALLFIAGHGANTGFAWTNSIFFFIHGISYCLLYLLTRSVWVPVGFHLAWNWTQGSICGMNVSGTVVNHSLFVTIPSGSEMLTGGVFGAEGSLISIVVSIFFIVILILSGWLKQEASLKELWLKYPAGFGLEPIRNK